MKKLLFLWALLISTVLQVNAQTWQWVGEAPVSGGSYYIMNKATNTFVQDNNSLGSALSTIWSLSSTGSGDNVQWTIKCGESTPHFLYIKRTGNSATSLNAANFTAYSNGQNLTTSNTLSTTFWIKGNEEGYTLNSYLQYKDNTLWIGNNAALGDVYVSANGAVLTTGLQGNTSSDSYKWMFFSPARLEAQQTVYNSHYNDYKDAYDAVVAKYPTLDILNELNTADYRDVEEKIDRLNQILENGVFTNPLLQQDAADPTVLLAEDGYYYMCCSEKNPNEGLPLWRSADMINWTKITNIFPSSNRPAEVGYTYLWAPELAYVNGKYVLFFANAAYGEQQNTQICVATADKPYGPYTYQRSLLSVGNSNSTVKTGVNNVIDPSLFIDGENKYLVWGSFNGVYYIELNDDCTSIKSGASAKSVVSGTSGDWKNIEAPMIIKHTAKDDGKTYYYLIASKGTTVNANNASGINYKIVMARGETLGGVFRDMDGNDSFDSRNRTMSGLLEGNDYVLGPGHNSQFVTDKNGTIWVFYHGYSKTNGSWDYPGPRRLFADKVDWDGYKAGWPCIWQYTGGMIDTPVIPDEVKARQLASAFQISNSDDLVNFATAVNGGNPFLNAVLTADIDCSGITGWTPIAKDEDHKYKGIFDGQNHRIMNLKASGDNDVALVGVVDGGAEFKNIIIDASCSFSGADQVAGFVGHAKGSGTLTFTNCGNEANIKATGDNASGFLGYTSGISTYWTNCYNAGNIEGATGSAAFSGWCGDHLFNCWNSGRTLGTDGAGDGKWHSLTRGNITQGYANTYELNSSNASVTGMPEGYTPEWLADGRLAYYMNQTGGEAVWTQKVDNVYGNEREGHPTFGSKEVIKSGNIYHNEMYYTRDTKEGTYGTICLPYASSSIEGADIYEVVGVRKNTNDEISAMVVEKVEGQLVAGKPYLFRATREGNGKDGLYVEYTGSPVTETVANTGMVGNLTMDKYLIPAGNYFLRTLSTGESVLTLTGDIKANVGSCRAYFSLESVGEFVPSAESQAKTYLVFGLDGVKDDADAIEALNAETINDTYYNMMGQRVNANAKGLVIKNGKKYLNK